MTGMNQRSLAVRALNIPLLVCAVLLATFGSVVVNSAVSGMGAGPAMFRRHLLGIAIGLIPFAVAWAIDYRKLRGWVGPLYILNCLLIISPLIPGLGYSAGGSQLWLQIGGVRLFQPSEPAKVLFVLTLAAIISTYKGRIESGKDAAKVLLLAGIPFVLVAYEDLGTALVFFAIAMAMLLIGGLRARWFLVIALTVSIGAGVLINSGVLADYQMNRLLVFVDSSRDPAGAGYNLQQSKIAIGSGELTGKGLGSGTQGNLNFLPERHTDFIFAVLGEELGFLGAVVLLGLYLALLITALEVAASSRDLYGSLIAAGIIGMWTFQILQNAGMTMGLMPITGIPLPFMSFGSSFMITNLMAVGMLLSVWTRRYS
jgi:rod shape determining protein RodA